jgi:hypothetical protein
MQHTQPTHIKVYYDGKLSIWDTYKPIIHANILSFGNYIDQIFVQQTFRPAKIEAERS